MTTPTQQNQTDSNVYQTGGVSRPCVNTHFTLAVVGICLSCFTGLFAVPLALAALILSLTSQAKLEQDNLVQARETARWAGILGWASVVVALLPLLLLILFAGIFFPFLAALLKAL